MRKKSVVFVILCMLILAVATYIVKSNILSQFIDHTGDTDPGMVFVALQPVKGLEVLSSNPIQVSPGSSVSFQVALDPKHYIINSDHYTFTDNKVTFDSINTSCTLYLALGDYYELTISDEGMGQTTFSQDSLLKKGDTVTLQFTPDDGNKLKSVKINDIYQQTPDDGSLALTISGDTTIEVVYEEIPVPERSVFNVIIMKDGEATILPGCEDLNPGTIVTLPQGDTEELSTSYYSLIGYNTAPDYSGEYFALGSMTTIGHQDLILYPQEYRYAESEEFTGRIVNSNYLIEKFIGTPINGIVSIPPFINGVPVTDINANAFDGISGLTTVIFPVGMKTVKNATISNCPDFTTLILPQSLTYVNYNSVANCPNFKNLRIIGTMENRYVATYDAALADKYVRLQSTEGKRIIIVAGSSASFGISSQMLEDAFPGYEIVNFGSSYLSGMHISLQLLNSYIHEGDIIILAPEYYDSSYASYDPVHVIVWKSIASNLNMLNNLDISACPAILNSFVEAMNLNRSAIASGVMPNSYINRKYFNKYGDLVYIRPVNNSKVLTYIPSNIINDRGMNIINSYVDAFTEKGATCLFSFPPTYVKSITPTLTSTTNAHLNLLSSKLSSNCTIISNPMDYYFTDNLFYDNYYHTTLEGAAVHTRRLINDLNAFLNNQQ